MYNTNILGVVPAGITILQNVNTHYLFIIITFFNYIASNYILGKFPKNISSTLILSPNFIMSHLSISFIETSFTRNETI